MSLIGISSKALRLRGGNGDITSSHLHVVEGFSGVIYPLYWRGFGGESLGLPVGANAKKVATWEPLLDKLKGKLNSWGNKYVSLGGRIVLLSM